MHIFFAEKLWNVHEFIKCCTRHWGFLPPTVAALLLQSTGYSICTMGNLWHPTKSESYCALQKIQHCAVCVGNESLPPPAYLPVFFFTGSRWPPPPPRAHTCSITGSRWAGVDGMGNLERPSCTSFRDAIPRMKWKRTWWPCVVQHPVYAGTTALISMWKGWRNGTCLR